jgi:ABC-type sugar transport system permease subunit
MLGYLFCVPAIFFFFLFKYVPIFNSFRMSFYDYTPVSQSFTGLANYQMMLTDNVFWQALWNTTIVVAGVTIVGTAIGYIFALMFQGGVKGGKLFRTIYFLPVVTSVTVISLVWIAGVIAIWRRKGQRKMVSGRK